MSNVFQLLAIGVISIVFATSSIASAQTYLSVDFPGATATTLSGGPNPEGTSVGTYTDTSGVTHGFVLTKKGIFTSLDVPGSTATTPNLIDPQGTIVGSYLDANNVSHGFILQRGNFTSVDFPGAAGTVLTAISPTGEMSGFTCVAASCVNGTFHSFVVSKNGGFTSFDPPGATSSNTAGVSPAGAVFGDYTDTSGVGHGFVLNHGAQPEEDERIAVRFFSLQQAVRMAVSGKIIDAKTIASLFWLEKKLTKIK